MRGISSLSEGEWSKLFSGATAHVEVTMKRIPGARTIWVNQRVMRHDPKFFACGGTLDRYRTHLADSCGFSITEGTTGCDLVTGVADRYGGWGLGTNGGSGRAAVINGYYVKGVGRTPLIGVGMESESGHASGGAYVEEAVRETLFSELVEAEFPHGAVPTLAIIDIGKEQVWEKREPKREHQCLLVRPCFLRPAHFERAVEFVSSEQKQGHLDARRVRLAFLTLSEVLGNDSFVATYREFWPAWAEQLAYSFVHRMPHGTDNTSNISLDGKLLDFGAMAAVPSWARISSIRSEQAVGDSLLYLIGSFRQHTAQRARYWGRHEEPECANQDLARAMRQYRITAMREVLRVAGLTCVQADELLASHRARALARIIGALIGHFRRERFEIFEATREPRIAWDIDQLWSQSPPTHLRDLRSCLMDAVGPWNAALRPQHFLQLVAARCALRAKTREELYRERIKRELYRALETDLLAEELTQDSLDRVISSIVCRNRRDSLVEPMQAVPIGFARSAESNYALFRCLQSGCEFAVLERSPCVVSRLEKGPEERLYIERFESDGITFADRSMAPFVGRFCIF